MPVDLDTFSVAVRDNLDTTGSREITSQQDVNEQTALQSIQLEPKPGNSEPSVRASSLEIQYIEASQSSAEQIAQNMIDDAESGSYQLTADTTEELAGNQFRKFTYRYQSDLTSTAEVYRVIWVANINDYTYTLSLRGLLGDSAIPTIYAQVLSDLRFGETLGFQFVRQLSGNWVSRSESSNQYLSDLVSPAVTKIYHIVCASISFEFESASDQQCRAVTGSGFLISNDGYIATNGHVVVYEPADVLVNTLLADPLELSSFLTNVAGLDTSQISRLRSQPEELAAIVAKIYELPDDSVTFRNKQEVILVALGNRPLQPENEADIVELFSFKNTRDIKKAKLVDYSYSGKDQLNLVSGNEEGFTGSDVALLRV
ncbi:MAG: S1C family serine protease, partial [Actinobacteria bacterium]|nr:S1C family serine protease [Actinomycetota bacterium]